MLNGWGQKEAKRVQHRLAAGAAGAKRRVAAERHHFA